MTNLTTKQRNKAIKDGTNLLNEYIEDFINEIKEVQNNKEYTITHKAFRINEIGQEMAKLDLLEFDCLKKLYK